MENSTNVSDCHKNWQSAVREYEQMIRAARGRGLSAQELQKVSRPYLLRVDAAYVRLKQAEGKRSLSVAAL
ncbi:MAG TPA: hypothetical protein VGL97_14670 [Bryobacteraceae bacterium]|jgi:hypothetical protein